MAELDDILTAEAAKLTDDPVFYPPHQAEARVRRDERRARARSLTRAARAEEIAVALEQDDADLRRLLRTIHYRHPSQTVIIWGVAGDRVEPACAAGCGPFPCDTRLIVDGDEETIAALHAALEAGDLDDSPR